MNYTGDGSIGFNGPYKEIDRYVPPKETAKTEHPLPPLVIVLIIGGILLFASIVICVCIKKKNEELQAKLQKHT